MEENQKGIEDRVARLEAAGLEDDCCINCVITDELEDFDGKYGFSETRDRGNAQRVYTKILTIAEHQKDYKLPNVAASDNTIIEIIRAAKETKQYERGFNLLSELVPKTLANKDRLNYENIQENYRHI